MKSKFLLCFSRTLLLAGSSLYAINLQDWLKGGYQKKRVITTKHTNVAAVRGVEEPGDVDPEARDFEGLKKVEQRKVPKEKVLQFIEQGKLKKK